MTNRALGRSLLAAAHARGHNGCVSTRVPIRPAATVIVLRDAPGLGTSALEVLLVQRASELAFHGGAWVFPGGGVDASELSAGDELAAARRAAVRETQEEAGLTLQDAMLAPFSHWTTPEERSRRFATWFFLAQVDPDREAVVDGSEIRAHRWYRPHEALLARERGEIDLPPPTYVTLSVLSRCSSAAEALAQARAGAPPVFLPRPRPCPGGVVSLFPGDAAYEGGELECVGPRHRLWMLGSGYRYECVEARGSAREQDGESPRDD